MRFLSLAILFLVVTLLCIGLLVRNRLDFSRGVQSFSPITQDFTTDFSPKNNDVNIIVLHLKNPGLLNNDQYKLSLLDHGNTVFEQEFSGFNVGDPSDLRFQFSPIDSRNRILTLRVSQTTNTAKEKLQIGLDPQGQIALQIFYRNRSIWPQIDLDSQFLLRWIGLLAILVVAYEKTRAS